MLIGILSDSHGDAVRVRRALALFDKAGARKLIHCGDVGGSAVFEELVGRDLAFVWGNTDCPDASLTAFLETVGVTAPDAVPLSLTLAGRSFAVYHGHELGFNRATGSLDVDYILHGHSHQTRDERRGPTRIINPGALHRARRKTVALLDPAIDELTFHEIP